MSIILYLSPFMTQSQEFYKEVFICLGLRSNCILGYEMSRCGNQGKGAKLHLFCVVPDTIHAVILSIGYTLGLGLHPPSESKHPCSSSRILFSEVSYLVCSWI